MSIERTGVEVNDLRSALELLEKTPGQLISTDVEIDPVAELSGVYRYVGAGGTVKRPTKTGPAMLFNSVKGHPDARVVIGLLASRERDALLLGCKSEDLGRLLNEALDNRIAPIEVTSDQAPCQEVVHLATEPDFDVRKLVPAPTNTLEDAGPYVTIGMCYATDIETGVSDITIHRLCLQTKDEITMYFVPGSRHLGLMREKAEAAGKPLPITISIGVDPAIEIASGFEPPTTPYGLNELSIAGGIRNKAVELVKGVAVNELAIANAEYVIEGELLPDARMEEDSTTGSGKAMPEFPGYTGSSLNLPIIKVKAVTTRKNPIMQTLIGPSQEHVSIAGIPTEASVLTMVERAMPGRLQNVYAAPCGGGKFVAVLQFKKNSPADEGRQRQAALLAFSAFSELKHVFLVDEDVDPFDLDDVMWAMTTRFQADIDMIPIPGVHCHPLDPSNATEYNPMIRNKAIACKAIFDCTVPYAQKDRFTRSQFMELDPKKWLAEA